MTLRRAALLLCFLFAACKAKLDVDLQLDGEDFKPKSCRSGQPNGFAGIDLVDAAGKRVRLVLQTDGTSQAFLFEPNAQQGTLIGTCGPMSVSAQNSTINDVRNVEGKATLDCSGNGHSVKGTVTFKNCH
jgi:hypothetical protein